MRVAWPLGLLVSRSLCGFQRRRKSRTETTSFIGREAELDTIEELLRLGPNRIAIEASHPTGAGGILFSLDISGHGRDALVSNGEWRVDPDPAAIRSGGRYLPTVWGLPPQYPWGYPRMPRPNELENGSVR